MNHEKRGDEISHIIKTICEIRKLHPKKNDGKWPSASGLVKCPKCGKNVYYTVSSSNGHILGKCETKKCLNW